MTNHYYLLVETPEANLAQGMRQLNGTYTQNFNRDHARVGHVFQGRYPRIEAMVQSYVSGQHTMAAIAKHFGVHYSTVSRAVKEHEKTKG